MISIIFGQDSFKILSLFSLSPGSGLNRKEIKARTALNNVPLDNALRRLVSSGLLLREGNYYSVNFGNEKSKKTLELCIPEKSKIRELPFFIYLVFIDLSYEISLIKGAELFLFGSFSKLIYNENSDIDIAIILGDLKERRRIEAFSLKLEKKYGKNIELHFFLSKDFYKNRKDPLVKSIIKDGIKFL